MLIAIVVSLGSALFAMLRPGKDPKRMVKALAVRVGLSVAGEAASGRRVGSARKALYHFLEELSCDIFAPRAALGRDAADYSSSGDDRVHGVSRTRACHRQPNVIYFRWS